MPMQVIAVDGVPVNATFNVMDWVIPAASRLELLITPPAAWTTAQLVSLPVNTGPIGDNDPYRVLANITTLQELASQGITVPANAIQGQVLPIVQLPVPPMPYQPTLFSTPATINRTFYFTEVLVDPTNPLGPTNFFITVDGPGVMPKKPDLQQGALPYLSLFAGDTEMWRIENRAGETHVFHVHQSHFLFLEENGVKHRTPWFIDTHKVDFWNGTMNAQGQPDPPYPYIIIKIQFAPTVVGEFVFHCHLLGHEDNGMLQTIQVKPPPKH